MGAVAITFDDDRLNYSSVPPAPAHLSAIAIGATLSIAAGLLVLVMSWFNWELQVFDCFNRRYMFRLAHVLYHNGILYCLDPFWIASFSLIIPAIWLKRRFIDRIGAKSAAPPLPRSS
jgi:hypothetical protein